MMIMMRRRRDINAVDCDDNNKEGSDDENDEYCVDDNDGDDVSCMTYDDNRIG